VFPKTLVLIIGAAIICAARPDAAAGSPAIVMDARTDRAVVGAHLEILEDPHRALSFEDVRRPEHDRRFRPAPGEAANFGYVSSAFWARFRVEDAAPVPGELYLEMVYTHLDRVTLHLPRPDGSGAVKRGGDLVPYRDREVKYRNTVFILPPERGPRTLYVHVDTESSMQLAMNLWRPRAFAESIKREQYVFGLFYGIMLVMAVYNLFLFLFVRDINYLYYVLYVVAYALVQISYNGIGYEYLWPDQVWWNNRTNPFFIGFSSMCIIQFARSFLGTRANAPLIDVVLRVSLGLAAAVSVLSLAGGYQASMKAGLALMLVETVIIFVAALMGVAKRYRPARYFLVAWTTFLFGIAAMALKTLGALPDTFITNYSIQIGSALETVLLSVALADRINTLRDENEKLSVLHKELEIARRIQRSILPEHAPQMPELDIQVRYLPMESVGGDFYDFHVIDRERFGVIIADVSGHGVPAALIAAMLKVAFSMQRDTADDPAALLTSLNATLAGKFSRQFITANYSYLDLSRNVLASSSAGHFPVLVIRRRDGHVHTFEPRGRMMGFVPEINAGTAEIAVGPGDRIMLYTDGVIELRNRAGELFGSERLVALTRELSSADAAGFADAVIDRLTRWRPAGGSFEDDITLIVIDILDGSRKRE